MEQVGEGRKAEGRCKRERKEEGGEGRREAAGGMSSLKCERNGRDAKRSDLPAHSISRSPFRGQRIDDSIRLCGSAGQRVKSAWLRVSGSSFLTRKGCGIEKCGSTS